MSKEIFPKIILFFLILGLILPLFSFGQEVGPIQPPETIEEAKQATEKGIRKAIDELPAIVKKIWREEVVPIWQKMWDYFKGTWLGYLKQKLSDFWYSSLKPEIQYLSQKFRELIGKEVEERKPIIEEEFQKEKEQMREEIPKVTQSLWERFKALLK